MFELGGLHVALLSYDGFVELSVELWSVTQGTEYESKFSNVMNEAVLRLETQVVLVVCLIHCHEWVSSMKHRPFGSVGPFIVCFARFRMTPRHPATSC